MPLHNVGYRGWNGHKTPQWSRWWIIANSGISLAFRSRWVRRLLFFAFLPVVYWGFAFFFIERAQMQNIQQIEITDFASAEAEAKRQFRNIGSGAIVRERFAIFPFADEIADAMDSGDPAIVRNTVWNWLLMIFFRYPQATLILFLIGFIAPGLISRDMRSRAFLLYFSRPIGRVEYIIGKLMVPGMYIVAVTTVPALILYLFAIALSPDLSVIASTWDIPIRIILASIVLVVPTSLLALMFSSLTHESRFASFAWFAMWALGHGAWVAVLISQKMSKQVNGIFDQELLQDPVVRGWSVLSLYNNLGDIQSWIFGFSTFQESWPGIVALAVLSVFALIVLFRRVSAPIRV